MMKRKKGNDMNKETRCEALQGGRFDTPQCKKVTTKTASGIPFCGEEHDFETLEEMWNRLYIETMYQVNQYEGMLSAKSDEIMALRKQVAVLELNTRRS